MTIQEAIKSGKRFKQKCSLQWEEPFPLGKTKFEYRDFDVWEMLADDWEVEERPITITKSEFIMKLAEQMKLDGIKLQSSYGPAWPTDSFGCQYIADHLFEFLERLGFEK